MPSSFACYADDTDFAKKILGELAMAWLQRSIGNQYRVERKNWCQVARIARVRPDGAATRDL